MKFCLLWNLCFNSPHGLSVVERDCFVLPFQDQRRLRKVRESIKIGSFVLKIITLEDFTIKRLVIQSIMRKINEICWYVMRVTYQRELLVKSKLETMGVHCYVPIVRELKKVNGKFSYKQNIPLHNFIFIYSSFEIIQEIKKKIPILRYMMTKDVDGLMTPMIVPTIQMERFMMVFAREDLDLKYYYPSKTKNINLLSGDMVRVTAGPFKGLVGKFVKFHREKFLRVVVEIDGIIGVATENIPPDLVEKL